MSTTKSTTTLDVFISPEALLDHWQGHRRLTRKLLEIYPEDHLQTYSIGGMRSFSGLIQEMLSMAAPTIKGFVTGSWPGMEELLYRSGKQLTKSELLDLWDQSTKDINALWPQLNPHRFQEIDKAFGQWEGPLYALILYLIDNEIHHRAQGYVYLRSLGIEPPAFWDRT